MAETNQFDFPEILAEAISPFSHGFGLNPSAGTLVLLQMAGAMCGPSVQVRTPDLMDLTPAFDLGCIHDGRAMLPGAALAAFGGAHQEILDGMDTLKTADRREWIERLRELEAQDGQLITKIKATEEVAAGHHAPDDSRSAIARAFAPFHRQDAEHESKMELPVLRQKLEDIQRQIVNLRMLINPGVIRKSNDWSGFPEAGKHTFDGYFVHIAEAGSLLAEASSKANRLKACTELLRRSRSDSPISGFDLQDKGYRACLHLFGTEAELSGLLHHPRIKSLGLLNSLILCESDAEQPPDVDALGAFGESQWHGFMSRLLRLRAAGSRDSMLLDREGCVKWIAFREWCREFNLQLAVEKRGYFLRWPELMVRIASCLSTIAGDSEDGTLHVKYLEMATAFLKDYAVHQVSVLDRLLDKKPDATRLNDGVEKLVQRLRDRGPQTRRQLARGIHGQDYNVIDASIFQAIRLGLVVQSDGRYCAVSVSVNASTAPSTTDFEKGVAA